jgi:hypothetical protein
MKKLCAWCGKTIGISGGRLRGREAASYGMCSECVAAQLAPEPASMGRREIARARRMHRSGKSLHHIERILGIPSPTVRAALEAA